MNRDALVVGINQYPFLKDTPTSKAKNLKSPASSAEAIALRLEKYGGFRVRRLPETIQEEQRYVDPESVKLDADTLEDAIVQLFNPVGDNSPETALLYFIGHGLRKERGGVTEGFLATSDVSPRKKQWGVSLRWLRELLQKSPVQQQIVWLDCCYSGELLNFTEADLGTAGQGHTRFLIAAAREFELAEEDIQGQHGVFSRTLLEGLDPRRQPKGVVNNDRLIEYIDQTLKGTPQQPIWYNPNHEIILTGAREKVFVPTPDGVCPYKGLRFFDVEDAPYFYGREALTQKLIERVQVGKGNFLAVLGVSGSGKSSVLRAGLMYQLQQERRLPGTEQWKIRIFTPGEQPLVSLATAFLDEEVTDIERAGQLREAEAAIKEGATGLARLIRASKSPRTVLIVDQFEEVFTVCQSQTQRQQFICGLLGALKQAGDKLCLILAMRDDFLGKCVAYRELADLIQANLVMVTPMSAQELRLAIVEPATKLGRKVEENLINAIFKDLGVQVQSSSEGEQISEPEPGMLPLLEYTLEQLWQRQTLNWLKLDSYIQLGGVQKTLENLAEEAYRQLSVEEQQIADQICIKLTQLGEGTPDTRKQVPQRDLVAQPQSADLVEQVIQKLAQAKLIVTSEQRKGQEKIAVVDVAHEALIRYWSRLRELLDNNREAIRTERKIQTAAQEWRDKEESKDYLLTGLRLGEVETFLQDEADIVPLSSLAKEFIQESQEERDRLIKEEEERQQRELRQAKALTEEQSRRTRNARQALSIVALLLVIVTGVAIYANSQRIKAQEEGDRANREARIAQARELATISLGIPDRKTDLRLLLAVKSVNLTKDTRRSVLPEAEIALYRALTQSTLRGEFIEDDQASDSSDFGGWTWPVTYNKSSKQLVVSSAIGPTILLDDKGVKVANLTDKDLPYNNDYGSTYSPDGNTILTAGSDGNVRFWNLKGELLRRYQAHSSTMLSVQVTSDYILTVGCDDADVSYYVSCDNLSLEQKISDESLAKALGNYICNNSDSKSITDITSTLTKKYGRGLLLIDTLDLVLNLAFIEPFHRVLRELTNRGLTVVFTCRDYEYENILDPDVNLYGLASNVKRHPVPKFSNQEILQAAQVFFDKKSKNLNAINKGKAFGEEIIALSAHDYQLREIICKPLLLRMLCELFEDTGVVPKNMTVSHLYRMYWNERIAKLRQNSSGSTGIVPAKVARKQENICWNIAKAAFETSYERLELLVRFSDIVEEEKLDEITDLAYKKLQSEGIIIADNKYVDVVRFFHQSFLEYAIALWLDKREAKDARERLLETLRSPYAWFDWWRIMREYLTIARPGEFEYILNTNLLDMSNERAFYTVAFAAASRDDPSALYKLLPTALVQGEQYQQILFDAAISTPISHAEAAWNVILTLLREGEYKIAANIAQKSREMLVRLKPQLGFCINEALDAIRERTVENEV